MLTLNFSIFFYLFMKLKFKKNKIRENNLPIDIFNFVKIFDKYIYCLYNNVNILCKYRLNWKKFFKIKIQLLKFYLNSTIFA